MDNVSFDESVQPAGPKPRLVMSRNTRLSKVPGVVSKAPGSTPILVTSQQDKGGAIPLGHMDSTLLPASAESNSSRRSTGEGVVALGSQADAFYAQSAYYPAQVTSAGLIPGGNTLRHNVSSAYQASTGWTYHVSIRTDLISVGAYLTVIADDGQLVVPLSYLIDMPEGVGGNMNYAAVTVHGDTVVFWYASSISSLSACTLTVSSSTLTASLGSPVSIHTFTATWSPWQVQIAYDVDDTSNAYVVVPSNVGADLQIKRIAIPALSITTTVTRAGDGGRFHAIAYRSGIVLVASSDTAVNTTEVEYNQALTQQWENFGVLSAGPVSCGFETYGGTLYRVFACGDSPAAGSPTFTGTRVEWMNSAGAQFASGIIRNQSLIGQIINFRTSDGTYACLFPTQAVYDVPDARNSYDPGSDAFVADPSIELMRMVYLVYGSTSLQASVVARVGTDLAIRYPGILSTVTYGAPQKGFYANSNNSSVDGQRILLSYLAENVEEGNVAVGYAARYVWFNFGSVQPRLAHTADGTTIIAGALPAVWDGQGVMEFSPMRQPVLTGTDTGGFGGAWSGAPATYQLAAVTMFDDAQGQTHRSPPSNVVELTGTGIEPTLTVKLPVTYRDIAGQFGLQVVVYASEPDGLTPYAQDYWLDTLGTYSPDDEETLIDNIAQPVVDAFHPAIYTLGGPTEPLATFAPNACLDVAVIADRVWMLDAERPSRWWYSKPKEPGFFAEMCPDLFVDTPSSAGAGVAISEWNGNPLFLTARGIWTVSGEGPDALLNPPLFSSAVQVSDIACTQRNSVVRSPAGVMFVSNNRFVRFKGQVFEYPEINAAEYGDVIGTAVFRDQQEVVFFCAEGYAYVYNWVADAWTVWDQDVTGIAELTGCAQRSDGKVLLVSETAVRLLDPDSVSSGADIYLETGWIVLGGPQDHNTLDNIVLHAKRTSEHALSIGIAVDYNATTVTRAYTAANVLASVTDQATSLRYDLLPQCPEKKARAVKLTITESEATGEAFQPINLTIEMIKQQGRLSQSIRDQARK
jgi:hypothetical protein